MHYVILNLNKEKNKKKRIIYLTINNKRKYAKR